VVAYRRGSRNHAIRIKMLNYNDLLGRQANFSGADVRFFDSKYGVFVYTTP
jgi:hypothetical protein